MISTPLDWIPIRSDRDLSKVRRAVGRRADELAFSGLEKTRVLTAASEIGRNTLVYGGGGSMRLEALRSGPSTHGLRLIFEDRGDGIEDPALALSDGFTTGSGLGLGLGGAKRLVDEMEIESAVGEGTTISMTSWRRRNG